jgi:hypothetical protein
VDRGADVQWSDFPWRSTALFVALCLIYVGLGGVSLPHFVGQGVEVFGAPSLTPMLIALAPAVFALAFLEHETSPRP